MNEKGRSSRCVWFFFEEKYTLDLFGNFGNVLAGWLAHRMGLPVQSFRVATNQNDILHRFFSTGIYNAGVVTPSHAPSMDIQAASNFERYLYFLLGESAEAVVATMAQIKQGKEVHCTLPPDSIFRSSRMTDEDILATIHQVHKDFGYVVDPHTATAFTDMAAEGVTSVILATAHPAKFPEVVQAAIGHEPLHHSLERLKDKALHTTPLPLSVEAIESFIKSARGQSSSS